MTFIFDGCEVEVLVDSLEVVPSEIQMNDEQAWYESRYDYLESEVA